MEIFMTDVTDLPNHGNMDMKNEKTAEKEKDKVIKNIYEPKYSVDPQAGNQLKKGINEDKVEQTDIYSIFNQYGDLE